MIPTSYVSQQLMMEAAQEAEVMPGLMHNYERPEGERFDICRSEVAKWLMAQPKCSELAYERAFSSLVHSLTLVGKDTEGRRWEGCGEGMSMMRGMRNSPNRIWSARSEMVKVVERMPCMESRAEVLQWLRSQEAVWVWAATRLQMELSMRFGVIRASRGKGSPWIGCGRGSFEARREGRDGKTKAAREEKRANLREVRERALVKKREELARKAELKSRGLMSNGQKWPGGGMPRSDYEQILDAMCEVAGKAPCSRKVLFEQIQAKFPVSTPTLDRYRRTLMGLGRLVQEVPSYEYHAPRLAPVVPIAPPTVPFVADLDAEVVL